MPKNLSSFLLLIVSSLLLCWLVIFFCFRLSSLTEIPTGMFVDESSIGYNAYSILQTGVDEHGIAYPLYFKAFGDYKNGLFIYSVVPIFKFFGTSIESLRLTSAIWGIAAIGVFALLLRTQTRSKHVRLFGVGLALTSPWLLQLARVAFEVASFPFFLFGAAFCFYKLTALRQRKESPSQVSWLIGFVALNAGVFYAYTSGRVLAPILLLSGLFLIRKQLKLSLLIGAISLFGFCLLPALSWETNNQGALLARYQVVGLSHHTKNIPEFLNAFGINYIRHFSPSFLLLNGDGNLRHSSGALFLIGSIPLIVLGLFRTITVTSSKFERWALLGLLAAPIPSALTIQSPHSLRASGMAVFGLILGWIGICYACTFLKGKILVGICGIFIIMQSFFWLNQYTTTFARSSRLWFDAGTVEALDVALLKYDKIYVSEKLYPGTYATAEFLKSIASEHSRKQPELILFNPDRLFPNEAAGIVLDLSTCRQIPPEMSEVAPIVFENDGACVVETSSI